MRKILTKLNVPKHICCRLVGKQHKFRHRAAIGLIIMAGGVFIAKTIGHSEEFPIAIVGDMVGYGLHGVGLIPFVEFLLDMEA